MAKEIVHVYHLAGEMSRVEDGWCNTCQVSSLHEGKYYKLTPKGVEQVGTVKGCGQCEQWVVTYFDGGKALITENSNKN